MSEAPIAALVLLLLPAAAGPAQAQGPSFAPTGATYEHLAVLPQQAAIPVVTSAAVLSGKSRRSGALLMIVGVSGIVTGLVVDEPVVTIAGAVVGGIGLYMYLDNSRSVQVGYRVPLAAIGS